MNTLYAFNSKRRMILQLIWYVFNEISARDYALWICTFVI